MAEKEPKKQPTGYRITITDIRDGEYVDHMDVPEKPSDEDVEYYRAETARQIGRGVTAKATPV